MPVYHHANTDSRAGIISITTSLLRQATDFSGLEHTAESAA